MNTISSLSDADRAQVASKLQAILIDSIALARVAQRAHWNVRGTNFHQLHELFGKLYSAADEQIDPLAEHIALLGIEVQGDHVEVVKSASVQPVRETDPQKLCTQIFGAAKNLIARIDAAAKELGTVDLNAQQMLLDASLTLGKPAWMLGRMLDA